MTNRKIEYWVIPPTADAEFVASMEDVLEVYEQPYDARCPVVCMDELTCFVFFGQCCGLFWRVPGEPADVETAA